MLTVDVYRPFSTTTSLAGGPEVFSVAGGGWLGVELGLGVLSLFSFVRGASANPTVSWGRGETISIYHGVNIRTTAINTNANNVFRSI